MTKRGAQDVVEPAPSALLEPVETPEEDPALWALLRRVAHAPSVDPATLGRAPDGAPRPDLSGQRLAHFEVQERVAEGGMGVIYRAQDLRLRRTVALKVLPPHHSGDPERQQRLLREAQRAAAVNHANIAAIYELGQAGDTAFIAMEFVEGLPLRASIGREPLTEAEALQVAEQIAEALARAHQAGIVHRDLKPDNVMVHPDGRVKVLDFGLAKLLAGGEEEEPATPDPDASPPPTATREGTVLGTPDYMSPEQARGEGVDARTDVFAFGVLLHELLTGATPWRPRAPGLRTTRAARVRERRRDPSGPRPPPRLRALVESCLQLDPARRLADGAEVLAALRALAAARAERPGRMLLTLSIAVAVGTAAGIAALWTGWPLGSAGGDPPPALLTAQSFPRASERRLTANPADNRVRDAALSPDGRTLAYVDRTGLFLRTLDPPGTEPVALPDRLILESVSWFPGGQELFVTGRQSTTEGTQLWRVTPGGASRRLGAGDFASARVSPDGLRVAWIERRGLAIAGLDLRKKRLLGPVDHPGEQLSAVTWSPDSRRLAYVRAPGGDGVPSLETVQIESGERHLILQDPRLVHEIGGGAASWAPDGRLFFALSELPPREVGFTLWVLTPDPDTGRARAHPRMLQSWTGSSPGMLSAGPDGRLALARYQAQSDVYVGDLLEGGRRMAHPRRVTLSERNEHPAGWSPDGRSLLYVSDQDGGSDLYSQDLASGRVQRLLADRAERGWGRFMGDGRTLLFWRQDPDLAPAGGSILMRMSVPEGPAEPLRVVRGVTVSPAHEPAPAHARFRCPARAGPCVLGELADGVLVLSTLGGPGEERKRGGARPLGSRRAGRELLRVEGAGRRAGGWDLSPDGTRVALPGRLGTIRLVELATGRFWDRHVSAGCSLEDLAFSADGEGLFATGTCADERPYKVFFTPLQRRPEVLWDSSSSGLGHPVPSPDGKHLAVAVTPIENAVWMVEGL